MKTLAISLLCAICAVALPRPANAVTCDAAERADGDANLALSSTPVTGGVHVCDLHDSFNADRFPRFYQLLNHGLGLADARKEFFDAGLAVAEKMVLARRYERAGTLYRILLAHFPQDPRVLSSFAAVNMMQQRLRPATELIYRAVDIDSNDLLILSNAFAIAVLNIDHARAREINRFQVIRAPDDNQHLLRRALLASSLAPTTAAPRWQALVDRVQDENGKAYWKYLEDAIERFDPNELVAIANALIDGRYLYEAVILLDLIAVRTDFLNAYYIKAKALEIAQHYRLAYAAGERARAVFLQRTEYDPDFDRNLLYNLARLAYAAKNYTRSLELLDEFETRNFSHEQLIYLYAVNYTALGMPHEARPYLQQCAQQELPGDLKSYCVDVLARKLPATPPRQTNPDRPAIEISPITPGPDRFLAGDVEELPVNWLGRISSSTINETEDGVNIVWIAEFLQPSRNYAIEDNREYDVEIAATDAVQWFRVELQLDASSDSEKQTIREQFSSAETYILVDGTARGATPVERQLAASVTMRSVILTSTLNLVRSGAD